MKIRTLRLGRLSVPLKKPFKTALRTVTEVTTNVVVVETDEGSAVRGGSPTAVITGIQTERSGCGGGAASPAPHGQDTENLNDLLTWWIRPWCTTRRQRPRDIASTTVGRSRETFVRPPRGTAKEVETDYTISVNDPETMVKDRLEAWRTVSALKIKWGPTRTGHDPPSEIRSAVGRTSVRWTPTRWTRSRRSVPSVFRGRRLDIDS